MSTVHRLILSPSSIFGTLGGEIAFALSDKGEPAITVTLSGSDIRSSIPRRISMDSFDRWERIGSLVHTILAASKLPDLSNFERYTRPLAMTDGFEGLWMNLREMLFDLDRLKVEAWLLVDYERIQHDDVGAVQSCSGFISPVDLVKFGCNFASDLLQWNPCGHEAYFHQFLKDYC